MAGQSLRRSQFITTYGPGAILEGPDGPRVIPTLGLSGLFDRHRPTEFEITDLRLSQALLNNARILRLPPQPLVRLRDHHRHARDEPDDVRREQRHLPVGLRRAVPPLAPDQKVVSQPPRLPIRPAQQLRVKLAMDVRQRITSWAGTIITAGFQI